MKREFRPCPTLAIASFLQMIFVETERLHARHCRNLWRGPRRWFPRLNADRVRLACLASGCRFRLRNMKDGSRVRPAICLARPIFLFRGLALDERHHLNAMLAP